LTTGHALILFRCPPGRLTLHPLTGMRQEIQNQPVGERTAGRTLVNSGGRGAVNINRNENTYSVL
ncbi:hypothetical protein ACFO6W_26455, partial [Dysgonomonas termitidis]